MLACEWVGNVQNASCEWNYCKNLTCDELHIRMPRCRSHFKFSVLLLRRNAHDKWWVYDGNSAVGKCFVVQLIHFRVSNNHVNQNDRNERIKVIPCDHINFSLLSDGYQKSSNNLLWLYEALAILEQLLLVYWNSLNTQCFDLVVIYIPIYEISWFPGKMADNSLVVWSNSFTSLFSPGVL